MINWNAYLQSVRHTYAQGWRSPAPLNSPFPSPPLANLQVQAVECKQDPVPECQEIGGKLGVLEGLQRFSSEQVLLVGATGSGKSTALVQLLLAQIVSIVEKRETSLPIPVPITLRHYRTSIPNLIHRCFRQHQLNLERGEIRQLLFAGRLLLLLDGVEELPSESARYNLKAFRLAYPQLPMVLSAKDLRVGNGLELPKALLMQPLTEGQRQRFINRVFPHSNLQKCQHLGRSLQQLGRSPLQLQILCQVWERSRTVPPTLGLLLRQLMQGDRSIKSCQWRDRLLGQLAHSLIDSSPSTAVRYALPREEAETILTQYLQQAGVDSPRDRACEQLQALLEDGRLQGDQTIEFSHPLFQEYYAAQRLLELLAKADREIDDEEIQRNYLNYLKWTDSIALLLGLTDDLTLSLRMTKLALAVDVRLGARLAGEVKPEFQEQTVNLVACLDLPQQLKLHLLGITRANAAVAPLVRALACQDTQICTEAIASLAQIGSDDAIEALIRTLDSPELAMRRMTAEALGDVGSDRAAAALISILQQEKSSLRGTAAESLGKIGSERAIEGLIQALSDSKDFVRKIVAKSLGEIGSNKAIDGLTVALSSSDAGIRWVATRALGKIACDRAVEGLIQALEDKDFNIREIAAESLGKIASDRAVEGLIRALEDEDFNIREIAAESLGKIASDRAVEGLLQALKHKDSSVCLIAVKALGKTRSDRAVEGLIQVLNHPNASIAWMAVKALEEIGSESTIAGLAIALENPDSSVRKSAVEALGEIGSEQAVRGLLQALKNPDVSVCRIAAQALGKARSQQALEGSMQALEHPDPIVRKIAAEALSAKANSELIPEMACRLKTACEPDLLVRIIQRIQGRYQFYNPNFYG